MEAQSPGERDIADHRHAGLLRLAPHQLREIPLALCRDDRHRRFFRFITDRHGDVRRIDDQRRGLTRSLARILRGPLPVQALALTARLRIAVLLLALAPDVVLAHAQPPAMAELLE